MGGNEETYEAALRLQPGLPPAPQRGVNISEALRQEPGCPWPGTEPPASSLPQGHLLGEATGTPGHREGKRGELSFCLWFFWVAAGRKERSTLAGAVAPQAPFP